MREYPKYVKRGPEEQQAYRRAGSAQQLQARGSAQVHVYACRHGPACVRHMREGGLELVQLVACDAWGAPWTEAFPMVYNPCFLRCIGFPPHFSLSMHGCVDQVAPRMDRATWRVMWCTPILYMAFMARRLAAVYHGSGHIISGIGDHFRLCHVSPFWTLSCHWILDETRNPMITIKGEPRSL